jgi:hypothetical protein
VAMATTQHETSEVKSSRVTFGEPPRPYKGASAVQLADTVEALWDDENVRDDILGELLARALEAENALESQRH